MLVHIKKTVSFLVVLLAFAGCDNFLSEEPRDVLSPDTFFNSDEEAIVAVNGLYEPLYDGSMYGNYGVKRFYMYGADVIEPSREGGGSLNDINNYTLSVSRDAGSRPAWNHFYEIIQNANVILDRVEGNENISPEARDQVIGETLFLRSFAYYNLTNMFGDVPYYRENLTVEETQTLSRHDREEIRNDIVQDLQQAQDLLPGSYADSEQGRPNSWAAATLAAKIHLIQENWEQARDKSVEVINNSSHQLLDDYGDVYDFPDNEFNDEVIWSIVFVKDENPAINTSLFSPRLRDEPANAEDRDALSDSLEARGEGFTGYGLAIPKCGFVDEFPQDDLRRQHNITEEYLGFELNYPYMPKMWNLDETVSPRQNHGENYIIFRLADVYLMAAEAENELNGPGNAYQYVNTVRERAFDPVQPLSGMSQQQFREAIYEERRWELAGEGHRRMDLIRWGILEERLNNTRHCAYNPAENFQPHQVLFPIPEEEIELNPNLEQNPGY